MEKAFIVMNIDEWELLYNKSSHTNVQELVFPSQAMEEEELSLRSNIKQHNLKAIQPNFLRATEVESFGAVVEVVEGELDQFSNYEKQSDNNKEEEEEKTEDELAGTFESMARKSKSISFEEEEDEEEEEEEAAGEMVEYTGPEPKQKSGCNAFRLRNLLRSAGLAAATFGIFILQKSMPKNQKIQFRISKNELELQKAKQLFQHQQEGSEPLAANKAYCSFSGRYDEWY